LVHGATKRHLGCSDDGGNVAKLAVNSWHGVTVAG
jgi:hypothetical protein